MRQLPTALDTLFPMIKSFPHHHHRQLWWWAAPPQHKSAYGSCSLWSVLKFLHYYISISSRRSLLVELNLSSFHNLLAFVPSCENPKDDLQIQSTHEVASKTPGRRLRRKLVYDPFSNSFHSISISSTYLVELLLLLVLLLSSTIFLPLFLVLKNPRMTYKSKYSQGGSKPPGRRLRRRHATIICFWCSLCTITTTVKAKQSTAQQ